MIRIAAVTHRQSLCASCRCLFVHRRIQCNCSRAALRWLMAPRPFDRDRIASIRVRMHGRMWIFSSYDARWPAAQPPHGPIPLWSFHWNGCYVRAHLSAYGNISKRNRIRFYWINVEDNIGCLPTKCKWVTKDHTCIVHKPVCFRCFLPFRSFRIDFPYRAQVKQKIKQNLTVKRYRINTKSDTTAYNR